MPTSTREEAYHPSERRPTDRERDVLPYSDEEIDEMKNELWPPVTVKVMAMDVFNCSESVFYQSYSHKFTYRAYAERFRYTEEGRKIVPADYKIPAGAALETMAQMLLQPPENRPSLRV